MHQWGTSDVADGCDEETCVETWTPALCFLLGMVRKFVARSPNSADVRAATECEQAHGRDEHFANTSA
eukprot:4371982-Alexandrium_andersonii.AAC.1